MDKVLFSHNKDDWETPDWLSDRLINEFNLIWDVAATLENTKCFVYFPDSLDREWCANFWLNPPYSKLKEFVKKAYFSCKQYKVTGVLLIPSRTDTKYWHDYIMKAKEIRFIKGRLKFKGAKSSAPFPSCIVIFDGYDYEHPKISTMERSK